jgi:WD40 repeat protein
MLPPTVPPPEQFLASVTPSQIEPIVSSESRAGEDTRLPTGDASRGIAWSPDGERLAIAGFRGVWLYDGRLDTAPRLLAEADAGVLEVAFSPDSSLLATLSVGQTLRIWDVEAGEEMATMTNTPLWDDLQFGADGQYLVSKNSDQRVLLAGVREGVLEAEPLTSANLVGYYALLNPDGTILTGYNNDGDVILLDFDAGKETGRFQYTVGFVRQAGYSPDGELLALGGDEEVVVVSNEGGAIVIR